MRIKYWSPKPGRLFADDGLMESCPIYPASSWPRSEEDLQRQEYAEAWAEVNAIAPGFEIQIDHDGHNRLGDYARAYDGIN